ncbi:MAG: XrtN system VIT domain-containing protein [Leptonema illini]|uniref:XrtN system VIT domain-containing protein n=1 Tax=Leptonema illini TaxID=183 RepID=A0A833H2N7_9LEPT|nr:MAG: XrtN system VIT domain-containing protein [Leptonema illini]
MSSSRLSRYFKRQVRIAGRNVPAWALFLPLPAATLLVVAFILFERYFFRGLDLPGWGYLASLIAVAVFLFGTFLLFLRALFTSFKQFIVFSLAVAAIAFISNAYLLDHVVFAPFTARTAIGLWMAFIALGLSVFDKWLPVGLHYALLPFLVLGLLLCLPFILILGPLLPFSWLLIPFGGLGFLPYSPLFALIAFGGAIRDSIVKLKQAGLKYAPVPAIFTAICILGYSAYYVYEWRRADDLLATEIEQRGLHSDLPGWVGRAALLPVNHVTEMALQPERQESFSLFGQAFVFDALAFLADLDNQSMFRSRPNPDTISNTDAARILHLLFQKSFSDLDRLWSGHSLITTDLQTHVQLHPELRVAYTEMAISVFNESSDAQNNIFGMRNANRPLADPQEAIYTITLPPGSIATKLTLFIDGEERPARLTFKEKAKRAYENIVSGRRDPSYIEWLDGNRLRLRVFPVAPQNYRTVRIGIVSPLRVDDQNRLHYERFTLDGPTLRYADEEVRVDVIGSAIKPESDELDLSREGDRYAADHDGAAWSLRMPSPPMSEFIVRAGDTSYRVEPIVRAEKEFHPSLICIGINDAVSRSQWIDLIERLHGLGIPMKIVSDEIHDVTGLDDAKSYLSSKEMPSVNLLPFQLFHEDETLWVTAGERRSVPVSELNPSQRFSSLSTLKGEKPALVAVVNGRKSEYVQSLADPGLLEIVAEDSETLMQRLTERKRPYVLEDANSIALPLTGYRLIRLKERLEGVKGGDLLLRLAYYRQLMRLLGDRYFDRKRTDDDLLALARRGMIVSPVSSLIVLETERDYRNAGIDDDVSELGMSKLAEPGAAPEPGEIALAVILLIAMLLFFYRDRLKEKISGLRWKPSSSL